MAEGMRKILLAMYQKYEDRDLVLQSIIKKEKFSQFEVDERLKQLPYDIDSLVTIVDEDYPDKFKSNNIKDPPLILLRVNDKFYIVI